jgi:hypothetical protein
MMLNLNAPYVASLRLPWTTRTLTIPNTIVLSTQVQHCER